jgi:hypothetical protein
MPYPNSNQNALLIDSCENIQNLTVTVNVIEDLVTLGDSGFSLQLNAYPQIGSKSPNSTPETGDSTLTSFQYVLIVANNQITWQIQYWANNAHAYKPAGPGGNPPQQNWPPPQVYTPNPPGTSPWLPVFPGTSINGTVVATTASNAVPAGSVITIQLATDSSGGNVTGATFSITDPSGSNSTSPWQQYAGAPEPPQYALYPIYCFQANLVGPPGANCTFTSGAGTLNYSVSQGALSVQTSAAPCPAPVVITNEQSNAVYGDVTRISRSTVSQPFGVLGADILELRLEPAGGWMQADLSALVINAPPAFPAASDPFAYVTPDKVPRVIYWGSADYHIHELRLQPGEGWIQADLSAIVTNAPPAFPAASKPFAYVTPDNVARVVYLGTDDHIHELRLSPGRGQGWIQADLSAVVTNAPPAFPAASVPFAYLSPDKVARVVYRGTDNHIHELRLQPGQGPVWGQGQGWIQADLSAIVTNAPSAFPAVDDPFAYVTPDNVARVVYRGTDGHIHELRLQAGQGWIQADLSVAVINAPPAFPAAGDPFAYVTPDNVARVVYLGTDGHIHELRLQPGQGWIQADLSDIVINVPPAFPAAGDPRAYVTPDKVARVVYRGTDDHVHELRLQPGQGPVWGQGQGWMQADLSAIVINDGPAVPVGANLFAYITPDDVPRVVYHSWLFFEEQ